MKITSSISFVALWTLEKTFDTMPRNNSWNRLEELKVPLNMRDVMIRLYENVNAKFKSTEALEEIQGLKWAS